MIALKCPACNGPLEAPEDRPKFFCQFCGTPVLLDEALRRQSQEADRPAPHGRPKPAVPIPDSLEIEEFGDELTIRWKWFSWAVLFLLPFAIAWNAFLIGWYAMATGFGGDMPGPMQLIFLIFPIGHVAVGLGLIYAVLTMLFNRTTVRVRNGQLSVSYGPIYFPGAKTVAVDEIGQLYCKRQISHGKNGSQGVKHILNMKLKSGRSVPLIKSISSAEVSQAVEQLLEKHLGIEDRPVSGESR